MGLADIRAVTIMNRSPTTMASINHSIGGGGQIVRKKRTFDIAFLTGQDTENEDTNSKSVTTTASVSSTLSSALIAASASKKLGGGNTTTTVDLVSPIDESTSNSTGSSIDVMTNGSLSESELNLSPCQRRGLGEGRRGGGGGQRESPSPKGMIITSSVSSSPSSSSPPAVLLHRHHDHRHGHHRVGSGASPKVRKNNNNRGEEIRFESKRTIDINQTIDSVKIKENLQFSSTLPTSIAAAVAAATVPSDRHHSGNGHNGHALHGSHGSIPFALLPQIAKFPSHVHLPSPFSSTTKMEKSESINIISYPTALNSSTTKMNRIHSQSNQSQSSFPDPYHLNIQIGPGGYPYPQNLMLPHDLNRGHNYHGHSTPISSAQQQHHHHQHQHGHSHHHSHSPPDVNSSHQISVVTAAATAATLLPPSLTALTLPAQNICAKCNIGFRMTSDLVYHMRSHHKRDSDPLKKKREEKLKCPVCHESFRERHHLTRHMTAHQDRAEEIDEKLLSRTHV